MLNLKYIIILQNTIINKSHNFNVYILYTKIILYILKYIKISKYVYIESPQYSVHFFSLNTFIKENK